MTTSRRLVLWVAEEDPPSKRALLSYEGWVRMVPQSISFEVRTVRAEEPEVSRVPCLHFMVGSRVVYRLEGNITSETVLSALRRLG